MIRANDKKSSFITLHHIQTMNKIYVFISIKMLERIAKMKTSDKRDIDELFSSISIVHF